MVIDVLLLSWEKTLIVEQMWRSLTRWSPSPFSPPHCHHHLLDIIMVVTLTDEVISLSLSLSNIFFFIFVFIFFFVFFFIIFLLATDFFDHVLLCILLNSFSSSHAKVSVHDVATILKEFLRDLPEPLLPREVYHPLLSVQSKSQQWGFEWFPVLCDDDDGVVNETLKININMKIYHSIKLYASYWLRSW